MAQKILGSHGVEDVEPGAFGLARVDLVLVNEVSGSVALREFAKMGAERVFDPAKIALVADHFVPAKDAQSAELVAALRRFAVEQRIDQYWEVGATPDAGIEHALLAELGLIAPGEFIPGGDSHTCTYGARSERAWDQPTLPPRWRLGKSGSGYRNRSVSPMRAALDRTSLARI
jgi:3-isopropylmalate/(R)-2-methylmalate dehydratase large subunit